MLVYVRPSNEALLRARVPGAQDQRGCHSILFTVRVLRARRAPGNYLPIPPRPRVARAQKIISLHPLHRGGSVSTGDQPGHPFPLLADFINSLLEIGVFRDCQREVFAPLFVENPCSRQNTECPIDFSVESCAPLRSVCQQRADLVYTLGRFIADLDDSRCRPIVALSYRCLSGSDHRRW